MSQDFAFVYLPSSASGTSLSPGSTIPYNTITNQPTPTSISLNAGTGVVTITDQGYYQISFGAMTSTSATNVYYSLQVNGTVQANQRANVSQNTVLGLIPTVTMTSLTCVVKITNPSTLQVVYTTGTTTLTLNDTASDTTGLAAYMNILKLQ
jgi:hypothetical protein